MCERTMLGDHREHNMPLWIWLWGRPVWKRWRDACIQIYVTLFFNCDCKLPQCPTLFYTNSSLLLMLKLWSKTIYSFLNSPAIINNRMEDVIAELSDSFNLTNAAMELEVKGEAKCPHFQQGQVSHLQGAIYNLHPDFGFDVRKLHKFSLRWHCHPIFLCYCTIQYLGNELQLLPFPEERSKITLDWTTVRRTFESALCLQQLT